jgi:hypothetical protein
MSNLVALAARGALGLPLVSRLPMQMRTEVDE